jgi:hypothetical protein
VGQTQRPGVLLGILSLAWQDETCFNFDGGSKKSLRQIYQVVYEALKLLLLKSRLLTWAHKLTENRRSLTSLPPFLYLSLL